MAALAFTSKQNAYMLQGPVCSLPIRPFWHRLAISWIPRYLIMIAIVCIYFAIYIHAEHSFTDSKLFRGRLSSRYGSPNNPDAWTINEKEPTQERNEKADELYPGNGARADVESGNGRSPHAGFSWSQPEFSPGTSLVTSQSTRHDSAATEGPLIRWADVTQSSRRGSGLPKSESPLDKAQQTDQDRPSHTTSHDGARADGRQATGTNHDIHHEQMRRKHASIRRQLRLLFIYPLCYFAMWLIPFVSHLMSYDNYRAQHPKFALLVLSFISVSSMGLVDSVVFSIRERPWRHIRGTDGTFLGSFCFWRCERGSEGTNSWPRSGQELSPSTPAQDGARRTSSLSMRGALSLHRPPRPARQTSGYAGGEMDGANGPILQEAVTRLTGLVGLDLSRDKRNSAGKAALSRSKSDQ